MAATRLVALHVNRDKGTSASIHERIDYSQNPEKTENGELITSYACQPGTAAEEFLLSRRQYKEATGREYRGDIIAYQIRQSFKPGEITPEDANKMGYELAMRFTYECQLQSEPRARLILSHLCSFESEPPKHHS